MRECTVCQSCFPDSVQLCDRDGSPAKLTLPIETVVHGRYQLVKRVGGGSVSVVYEAIDELNGSTHAVKIILPEYVGHSSDLARSFLLQEREALSLRHPNIVAVTDTGLINESLPFLVMDFISGGSLKDVLPGGDPLSPSEAFAYVSAIGKGLSSAHALGIVHGDLKPRNILIERDRPLNEAIKIADFGLSAIKSGKIHGPANGELSGVLRSPLYLAPEVWSEEEPDIRSDIYSLGVILYQMLAGSVPFKGKSVAAVMKAHLREQPPPLAGRSAAVTSAMEKVVMHALQKEPEKRPGRVEDFLEEFRLAITSASSDDASENEIEFDGARTIVLGSSPACDVRSVDLDATIVLSNAQNFTAPVVTLGVVDETPVYSGTSDLEATILPGAIHYEELVAEEVEVEVRQTNGVLQPILLALGVVIVIALIGIGVYYARLSQ